LKGENNRVGFPTSKWLGTQFEYGQLTNITELRHTGLGLGNY